MNSFIFNPQNLNSYMNYSVNKSTEIGYNTLTDKGQINIPLLSEIRKNLFLKTKRNIFNKIKNKDKLKEKDILIIPNSENGN